MPLPAPLPLPFATRRTCAICGQALTAHEAVSGGICGRHTCRHQAALDAIAARKANTRASLMANAAQYRDRIAATLRLAGPLELPIALVPASTRRLTPLPASRRRLFREHLEAVLARLAQTPARSPTDQQPHARADAGRIHSESPAVGAACAACRGHCCHNGGIKAYIDDSTLLRFTRENPSLDRNDTVRAYLDLLPRRSIKDSCVFHGGQGCTLPRDMRSTTCNDYHCEGVRKLQPVNAARVLITAATETEVVRCAVVAHERITATFQPGTSVQPIASGTPQRRQQT